MHHARQEINLCEILVAETEGKDAIGRPDLHKMILTFRRLMSTIVDVPHR